ncbi:MAG: CDP-alcohol phosphatidyltransferase family protein [Acidobacteriota bacterium]
MHSFRRIYRASVKSAASDEIINTWLQRPAAAVITYACTFTPVTPNQLTLVSTLFGIAAGCLLALEQPWLVSAGICAYMKDLFDSADGQLARATGRYSRRGRFLDSIGDFIVNAAVFIGITLLLIHRGMGLSASLAVALTGWLGVNLRVSYQVFYQTQYLHTEGSYFTNRAREDVRPEDELSGDRAALLLQRIFSVLYGWQDRLVAALDASSQKRAGHPPASDWYRHPTALRLNSFFGMGTEYTALALCLCFGSIEAYLILTLGVFNLLWAAAVVYRLRFAF